MTGNVSLYTVIVDNKDAPVEQAWPITVFQDSYDQFKDPRRNSRIQKILSHKFFDSEYTIYMDGNMKLLIDPREAIDRYLDGYDMALFKHGMRDCIYDEALECAKLKLDDPELIIKQAKYYEDHEYAKHKGLLQGGFIVRRNNERTRAFNEAWWADYCVFSRRDQLALMPAIDKAGVVVNALPDKWKIINSNTARMSDIVEITSHANFSGNFNDPNHG